jgi:pyruvate/2-oxoglutarate dehydrogenase complex dihydrolipoamide dehydrogenase (E3) component
VMTMQSVYDLAVIGAGPAGIVGATTAASMGARVALIDRYGDLGGAGANTGTVPSKTLRETALALSGIGSRDLYGVDLSLRREATVPGRSRTSSAARYRRIQLRAICNVTKHDTPIHHQPDTPF